MCATLDDAVDEIDNLRRLLERTERQLAEARADREKLRDLLKAMHEAFYDQPVGAWFGAIRGAMSQTAAMGTTDD